MKHLLSIMFIVLKSLSLIANEVPIINYAIDSNGNVLLEVNSSTNNYYLLKVRNSVTGIYEYTTSLTLGQAGTTTISEPLHAYPIEHYQVIEQLINFPGDIDNDGINDLEEYTSIPLNNPINPASSITQEHGLILINTKEQFDYLSVQEEEVAWTPYLDGKQYLKFIILDFPFDSPKVYFINSNTHELHESFANYLEVDHLASSVTKGHVTFHPNIISNNGTLGTYAFSYTNNESKDFLIIQRTMELLALNMPFIRNNLSYLVTELNEQDFNDQIELFNQSRVHSIFESDAYAGLNYWGLNPNEGYGFFKVGQANETPGPKDIVLYDFIPNNLPHIAGIITSVLQTPLSHVNLRAIQDQIPNAFIKNPLENDSLLNLLNHYIYFKVEQSKYTIREATIQEVNDWFENKRPKNEQIPPLNLDYKQILPLDQITFDMFDGYGAKASNLASMHLIGFPEGTIPDGFAVPFFYYKEFMDYNHFYEKLEQMIQNPDFQNDREVRELQLKEFRKEIKNAEMPPWMMVSLGELQGQFSPETPIRCRSSSNNEDLPGFSGAGLYDSKTQHPDEGHISKSIKQVYASLWNLRAFEEREFFRINHFFSAMGVLCHPNYENEKVNGVGVSKDPIYQTNDHYYINSQVSEQLITNPSSAFPEELLLNISTENPIYLTIQYSSLLNNDSLLMDTIQIKQLINYLSAIHNHFEKLYKAENNLSFAMDIEFKITESNQLAIKQARPWVSFERSYPIKSKEKKCDFVLFPNPSNDFFNLTCVDSKLSSIQVTDLTGKIIIQKDILNQWSNNSHIADYQLNSGVYILNCFIQNQICGSQKIQIY
jgi:hypothetical protein